MSSIDELACPHCSGIAGGMAVPRGNVHVGPVIEVGNERVVIEGWCECGSTISITIETVKGDLFVSTKAVRDPR